ncbi:hypothetical protein JGU71_28250 [Antrihabitans sp. YC3-6]|uniref:Uncharacterized protein n=1 Tax=Antrihabitans stalagmiti TaxID=2799499 RepID=A0A934NWY9_9NOCA|nr:hypothetical protein [Antrihabitans stalagmiti]MBJ8342788.1 hypothetical protein [Antrihabitans stalagmiti]
MQVKCGVCGAEFEARRSTAKYCSDRCRQRRKRGSEPGPVGLVGSVTAELKAAGRLDSFDGQLAVELARQLTAQGASGISSLSKELRTVMATALDGASVKSAPADADDEVSKAREARERKARQAAG